MPQYKLYYFQMAQVNLEIVLIPEKCKSTDTKRAAFHKREAAFFRFFTESWGKSSLGARLRTRKVRGRDASLPAPLLAASLGLVGRGTVGALPQTPQGTLSLDPARGRRKGTKSPLDPFARLRWSHSLNSSACGFFILPPPLPQAPATSPANPHSPSQSAHSGRAASSLPPPAIHTASAPRRRAGQCWSRSFHPADDRR